MKRSFVTPNSKTLASPSRTFANSLLKDSARCRTKKQIRAKFASFKIVKESKSQHQNRINPSNT